MDANARALLSWKASSSSWIELSVTVTLASASPMKKPPGGIVELQDADPGPRATDRARCSAWSIRRDIERRNRRWVSDGRKRYNRCKDQGCFYPRKLVCCKYMHIPPFVP